MLIDNHLVPGARQPHRTTRGGRRRMARRLFTALVASAVVMGGLSVAPASASTVTSAVFSGAGTVFVGAKLYAKQGAALTLTVVTSSDTKCVEVTGAATLPRQTSSTAKSNWTFTTTAPAGNGAQAFTVAASSNFNANNCNGQSTSTQASYTLDNTGPALTAAKSPAPNAAGWNKDNVTLAWSATDTGVGVASGPAPDSDSQSGNGKFVMSSTATDKLGNKTTQTVDVWVDKAAPSITATQT